MKEGLDSDQKGFNGDLPQPIEYNGPQRYCQMLWMRCERILWNQAAFLISPSWN